MDFKNVYFDYAASALSFVDQNWDRIYNFEYLGSEPDYADQKSWVVRLLVKPEPFEKL